MHSLYLIFVVGTTYDSFDIQRIAVLCINKQL